MKSGHNSQTPLGLWRDWKHAWQVTTIPMTAISPASNQILRSGDEVAILPTPDSPPADVLEIATVTYLGSAFLQLADGRMYATLGGKYLGREVNGYVVPATDEHRAAFKAKRSQNASLA